MRSFPRRLWGRVAIGHIVTAMIFICVLVLLLGVLPRTRAPIDLTAQSDVVTMQIAGQSLALPPFLISRVTLIGSGEARGSGFNGVFRSHLTMEMKPQPGTAMLSLSGLQLAPQSRLTLRRYPGMDRTFEFAIIGGGESGSEMTLFAQGAFLVTADTQSGNMTASEPTAVRVSMETSGIVLRLTLTEREWSIQHPFSLSHLDFRDTAGDESLTSLFSALHSGQIRFIGIESLDGSERHLELQARQMLTIGDIRDGFVSNLSLTDGRVRIGMSGYVSSLETAWRNIRRDHMPTWLATLSSIDYVKEIAGLALALFLAVLQILPLRGARP